MGTKCKFCGEDSNEWVDITQKVKMIPTVTSTPEKLGYVKIELLGRAIGSFGINGIEIYEKESIFWDTGGFNPIKVSDAIKVVKNNIGDRPFYYNIFIKKSVWEDMNAKAK